MMIETNIVIFFIYAKIIRRLLGFRKSILPISVMNPILILLKIFSFFFFFLLTKKFFHHFSTGLFFSVIFLIIPWQTQSSRFQMNKSLVLIITSLFFLIVYGSNRLPDFKKLVLIFVFFFLPSLFLSISNFPRQNLPFILNPLEINQITLYQNILNPANKKFSRFSSNKATFIIKNLEVNFFESFDFNYYFFANHPLERVGVKETEKFYSWLLPFFILGFICLNLLTYRPIILWVSSVLFLSSLFSNRFSELNILLMIPFLLIMGLGFEKIRHEIKI